MELKEVIKKRRSIRKYQTKSVSWDLISEVLESARLAPAAGNIQSYKFIVVQNQDKRKELAKICHDQEWMEKAPVHLVVVATLSKLTRLYGEKGETNYAYQNANAAIVNMILTANDLGLGTCWVSAINDKKLIESLEIEGEVKPIAIITLGYPKEKPSEPTRDPLRNLVFFEKWANKERDIVNRPLEKPIKRSFKGLKEALKNLKNSTKELK